jgi:hypothetical protein
MKDASTQKWRVRHVTSCNATYQTLHRDSPHLLKTSVMHHGPPPPIHPASPNYALTQLLGHHRDTQQRFNFITVIRKLTKPLISAHYDIIQINTRSRPLTSSHSSAEALPLYDHLPADTHTVLPVTVWQRTLPTCNSLKNCLSAMLSSK